MLAALVAYAFGWQQVIKHLPLTTAYANKAVTVVWGILLGLPDLRRGGHAPAARGGPASSSRASCSLCGPTTKEGKDRS